MSADPLIRSGLYLVSLRSDDRISVNADRPERADRCIFVNSRNCKFGRADDLDRRMREYKKIFGENNAVFEVLARRRDPALLERRVLERLAPFRIRGSTGRLNEWLEGISPAEVKRIAGEVLSEQPPPKAPADPTPMLCPAGTDPGETIRLLNSLVAAGMTDAEFGMLHHKPGETISGHRKYCARTQRFRPESSNARVQLRLSAVSRALDDGVRFEPRLLDEALARFPL